MGPQADHLLALGLNPPTQLGKRGSLNLYWTRKLLPDSNENMSLNTLKKKKNYLFGYIGSQLPQARCSLHHGGSFAAHRFFSCGTGPPEGAGFVAVAGGFSCSVVCGILVP